MRAARTTNAGGEARTWPRRQGRSVRGGWRRAEWGHALWDAFFFNVAREGAVKKGRTQRRLLPRMRPSYRKCQRQPGRRLQRDAFIFNAARGGAIKKGRARRSLLLRRRPSCRNCQRQPRRRLQEDIAILHAGRGHLGLGRCQTGRVGTATPYARGEAAPMGEPLEAYLWARTGREGMQRSQHGAGRSRWRSPKPGSPRSGR